MLQVYGMGAFGAGTSHLDLFLLYFEKACPQATLAKAQPNAKYVACWFNPRNGEWITNPASITADPIGRMVLPLFPDNSTKSEADWALKLVLAN